MGTLFDLQIVLSMHKKKTIKEYSLGAKVDDLLF